MEFGRFVLFCFVIYPLPRSFPLLGRYISLGRGSYVVIPKACCNDGRCCSRFAICSQCTSTAQLRCIGLRLKRLLVCMSMLHMQRPPVACSCSISHFPHLSLFLSSPPPSRLFRPICLSPSCPAGFFHTAQGNRCSRARDALPVQDLSNFIGQDFRIPRDGIVANRGGHACCFRTGHRLVFLMQRPFQRGRLVVGTG